MTAGCESNATTHFAHFRERHLVDQKNLCQAHGRALFQQFQPQSGKFQASIISRQGVRGIAFDVEAIYSEKPREDGWCLCEIVLLQTGGSLRIPIQTGLCELSALGRALDDVKSPQPLTHDSMAAIITDLGGRLNCVTLDNFIPAEGFYETSLHIVLQDRNAVVKTRASDAITLAVISNAPILVAKDVLTKLGGG